MGFARKITLVLISLLVLVGTLIGVFTYQTAYRQVEDSVGIETVGCANITTGLVDPSIIEQLAQGQQSGLASLEERLNWTVDHKSLFKEVFILSLDGVILAADSNLKGRGYAAGESFYLDKADVDMIKDMRHAVYSSVYTYDGAQLLSGYAPIFKDHDPNQDIIGMMVINFDASIIHDRTVEIVTLPFIIGGIIFVLTAIIVYFFIHRMIRPIEQLSLQVNRVAQGDLTVQPVTLSSKDEVGKLTRDFANMTANLRQLITEANDMSLQVASSSQQLSASVDQTGKASEQTANISQGLAEGAEKQLNSLEKSSTALQEMSDFVQHIVENTDNVSHAAMQSTVSAQKGVESIQLSVKQMNKMEDKMKQLSTNVETLGAHSREIQSILEIITDISAETNLLAINAAIEAARAGEYGSGFAVVASSVRKLAERSATSAQQIASIISFIVTQMESTANTMEEASHEVRHGTQLVKNAGLSFNEIELSSKTTEEAIEKVSAAIHQLSGNSKLLVQSIEQIIEIAYGTVDGAQSISAASEEHLAVMEEVDASATFLSSISEKLHTRIEKFKV
ncbi:methyl-accepting chemotaxis protein [Fontibacillus panacisegetis]|uniref:Methyl-accepting chemotaxis protein n=1 Tax=Fontibacillus panacisegetis TaxID=670482 RepID=A0A1G7R2L5_9BACL|nr:methyl-accepting chemotaxis protein [Fontibacillus panacisegetis]SDG04379.1 methyl-accepting chemotaxis protein [Fontibacillus panacisegetis]